MTILTCNRCSRRMAVDVGTIDNHPGQDGGICGGVFGLAAEDNPDYITLLATVNTHKFIVAWMTFNKTEDSYTMKKCSQALNTRSAQALGESWAAINRLEVR